MTNATEEKIVRKTDGRLFPARTVPSFLEVVGAQAVVEYYNVRQSLDQQELERASRRGDKRD